MKIVLEGVDPTTFNFVASALADLANILLATVLGAFYVIRLTKWIKANDGKNTLPVNVVGQVPSDLTSALTIVMGSGWAFPCVLVLGLFLAEYTSSIAFIGLDFVVLDRPGENATVLNLAKRNGAFPYQLVGDPVSSGTVSKLDLLLDQAGNHADTTELMRLANEEAVVSSFLGAVDVIAQGNSPFTNQSNIFEMYPTLLRLGHSRRADTSNFPSDTTFIYSNDSSPLISIPLAIPLECEDEPMRIQEAWGQDSSLNLFTTSLVPNCAFRSRRASGIYGEDQLPHADITAYVATDHNISLYLRGLEHHELRNDFDFPIDGAQLARDRVDFRNGRPVDDIGGLKIGNQVLPFDSAFLASGGPYPTDGSFATKFYAVLGRVEANSCPEDPNGSPESECIAIITLGCVEFSEDRGEIDYYTEIKRCNIQYAELVWGTSLAIDEQLLVAAAGIYSRQMKSAETSRQKTTLAIHALPAAMFSLASLEAIPRIDSVKSATVNGIFVVFLAYPFVVCLIISILVLYSLEGNVSEKMVPQDGWGLMKLGATIHTLPKQVQEAFQLDSQAVCFGWDCHGDFALLLKERRKDCCGSSKQVAVSGVEVPTSLQLPRNGERTTNPNSSLSFSRNRLKDEHCALEGPVVDEEAKSAEEGEEDRRCYGLQTNEKQDSDFSSEPKCPEMLDSVDVPETEEVDRTKPDGDTGPQSNVLRCLMNFCSSEKALVLGCLFCSAVVLFLGITAVAFGGTLHQSHSKSRRTPFLSMASTTGIIDEMRDASFMSRRDLVEARNMYFGSRHDRRKAIDEWGNISEWRVDHIDDFSYLFKWGREDTSDDGIPNTFNEDLSNWNVSSGVSFRGMFRHAGRFSSDLSSWDVSNGVYFGAMFYNAFTFSGDISSWNVSKGTCFSSMFYNARSFSSNLSMWDVSSGRDFSGMFTSNRAFSSDLSSWNVSRGEDFSSMFYNVQSFSSDLSMWDVSSGTDFSVMFYNAGAFSSDLSMWNVSKGVFFNRMFSRANQFSSDLSTWDVSSGTDFSGMFWGASVFSSDLSRWDVSRGTDFSHMFNGAGAFNSDLSMWDVSGGTSFTHMFNEASIFNSSIGEWDVSKGTHFNNMFREASIFNCPLASWEVTNVITFQTMFLSASSFNQNLCTWSDTILQANDYQSMFAKSSCPFDKASREAVCQACVPTVSPTSKAPTSPPSPDPTQTPPSRGPTSMPTLGPTFLFLRPTPVQVNHSTFGP